MRNPRIDFSLNNHDMKKKNYLVATLVTGCMIMTGCVSSKQFTALQSEHNALKQAYEEARIQLAECNSDKKNLYDRLQDEQNRNAGLRKDYENLQGSLDKSLQQN